MKLEFKRMGDGEPLIVLHGLFGSSDNWQTLGRRFAENYAVYLLDQRNHGRSPHSDDFNYELLAEDLREFMDDHGIDKAHVLGHSMGGKVAMRFGQMFPDRVLSLIVADMGIKAYRPHHELVLKAFHTIEPESLNSRAEAEDRIKPIIDDFGVRQFLLKNLYRKKDGGYGIRVNFRVMEREMDAILEALPKESVNVPVLFLYGENSDYVEPGEFDSIRSVFPSTEFVGIKAGHWLHAEEPERFYEETMKFLS